MVSRRLLGLLARRPAGRDCAGSARYPGRCGTGERVPAQPPGAVSGSRTGFCYDHLAGRLGIALADAWTRQGWLGDREVLTLSEAGAEGLRAIGVDVDGAVKSRRTTTLPCSDWTERRPHLAGALGAAVGSRFLEARWVVRHRAGRGLAVTQPGHALFRQAWGIDLTPTDRIGA